MCVTTTPCDTICWGKSGWKVPQQRRTLNAGQQPSEYKSAVCTCGQKGQWHVSECGQQHKASDFPPALGPSESAPRILCSALSPHSQNKGAGVYSKNGHKDGDEYRE